MLTLEFTAEDVAYTRFAISPLWEVVASVRTLKYPAEHTLHQPWVTAVRQRLTAAGLDLAPLADLVRHRQIAAFVCPPPTSPLPSLEVELAGLLATPAERLRAGIENLDGPRTPALETLHADPEAGLRRLVELVEAYWDLALAPHWPRMRTILEGDVLHRARRLAEGGARLLFADLDDQITWDAGTLRVTQRHVSKSEPLQGRGLLLVPSIFAWPRVFSLTAPGWQPLLRYPPRGVGTLWEHPPREVPGALAAVLGRTRAQLLAELEEPASTTDLAVRTGVTAGGVSQHLTALRDAGLVSAHRTGRFVLYARTDVAESLLNHGH